MDEYYGRPLGGRAPRRYAETAAKVNERVLNVIESGKSGTNASSGAKRVGSGRCVRRDQGQLSKSAPDRGSRARLSVPSVW